MANALVVAAMFPVVWLAARGLRKRPAAAHLLWLVLLVKLVMPPVVDWPWSAADAARLFQPTSPIASGPVDDFVAADPDENARPAAFVTYSGAGVNVGDIASRGEAYGATEPSETASPLATPVASGAATESSHIDTLALPAAWALGTAVVAVVILTRLSRQRRLLRESAAAPAELASAVSRVAAQFGVRPPAVGVSRRLSSPVMCCVGRPRLVWPSSMADGQHVEDNGGVLAHELAHLARRDHWVLRLELAATLCCWWNPLLWLVRRQLHETRELACDALALATAGGERDAYARRLLNLSIASPGSLILAPAFGARSVSRRFLRRRLAMVFDNQVRGRLNATGLAWALALAVIGLPGLAWAEAETDVDAGVDVATNSDATVSAATTEAVDDVVFGAVLSEADETVDDVAVSSDATVATSDIAEDGTIDGTPRQTRQWQSSQSFDLRDLDQQAREIVFPGGGGKIRLSRNADGNLVVTIEQTNSGVNGAVTATRAAVDWLAATRSQTAPSASASSSGSVSRGAPRMARGTDGGRGSSGLRTRLVPAAGSTSQVEPAPASFEPTQSRFDRDMLELDLELAHVNLAEKKIELQVAIKQGVDEVIQVAQLAVRRAEIELRRAKLRLDQATNSEPLHR
jgi:beta-lactamase regulating signal transducer with metallopeptidase domain